MNDQEIRAIVRDVIARRHPASPGPARLEAAPLRLHASHGLFVLPTGMDSDGPCLIEPAVTCNHCGYCKSLGH